MVLMHNLNLNCVTKFLPILCEFQALELEKIIRLLKNVVDYLIWSKELTLSRNKFRGKDPPRCSHSIPTTPMNCETAGPKIAISFFGKPSPKVEEHI